jgi:hypothetical protein
MSRANRRDEQGIGNELPPTALALRGDPIPADRVDTAAAGEAARKLSPGRRASLPERFASTQLTHIDCFDPQKGWDLPVELADDVLRSGVAAVVLESGLLRDHEWPIRRAVEHPETNGCGGSPPSCGRTRSGPRPPSGEDRVTSRRAARIRVRDGSPVHYRSSRQPASPTTNVSPRERTDGFNPIAPGTFGTRPSGTDRVVSCSNRVLRDSANLLRRGEPAAGPSRRALGQA